MQILSEKLLVKKLIKGNNKAFTKLFNIYSNDVYAYSISMLKTKELSKEIVQDVFMNIWQHKERLNPKLSFKSYVFTITRNLTLNLISKVANDRKLKAEVFYKSQKSYTPIENEMVEADYEIMKLKAIEKLPPRCKIIFEMSRNEFKSYEEISKELNISVSTVKGQMSKALAIIRNYFKTHEGMVFSIMFLLLLVLE